MSELEELTRQLAALSVERTGGAGADHKVSSHCAFSRNDTMGNYKIQSRLGRGRFSTAWSATHKQSGRRVAIKVYRAGHDKYFANEVKVFNTILKLAAQHGAMQNVVEYLGIFAHVSVKSSLAPAIYPCIILANGGDSLSSLIRHRENESGIGTPFPLAKKIITGIFQGLCEIHRHGIIHADIKPENILLGRQVEDLTDSVDIKIVDFGSASVAQDIVSYNVGTIPYLSPELFLGAEYTTSTDVWSALVTCFEVLTLDVLFDAYDECGIKYCVDDGPADEMIEVESTDTTSGHMSASSQSNSRLSDSSGESEDDVGPRFIYLLDTVIGPPPDSFIKTAYKYYTRVGKLKDRADEIRRISLNDLILLNYDYAAQECAEVAAFLSQGLKYNIHERATAREILAHSFLRPKN